MSKKPFHNIAAVARAFARGGEPLTCSHVMEITGLVRKTVYRCIEALEGEGLLASRGTATSGRGRPANAWEWVK